MALKDAKRLAPRVRKKAIGKLTTNKITPSDLRWSTGASSKL